MSYKNVLEFKNIEGLLFYDNLFWYNKNTINKRWRVGQVYIEVNKKRYGMNTLRKLAYKSQIEINQCPF